MLAYRYSNKKSEINRKSSISEFEVNVLRKKLNSNEIFVICQLNCFFYLLVFPNGPNLPL